MDNVCHTLVGVTLADAGLKRRTALGTATLVVGANFPDIDALSYLAGSTFALDFRRGHTHGILALVVLPFVLTGLVMLWERWVRAPTNPASPVIPKQILLLATLGIWSHPLLDYLNTYGMRWLMPFSDRWFYADTLFIVDPWMWAMLAGGIHLSRRRRRDAMGFRGPAAWSLAACVAYVLSMAVVGGVGQRAVTEHLAAGGFGPPDRLMVAPLPVTPFRRSFVAEHDGRYVMGTVQYLPLEVDIDPVALDRHPAVPEAAVVDATLSGQRFLGWARFPFSYVESDRIELGDARYTLDPATSWAGIVIAR